MCITKAIQSSPVDCLQYMSDDITWKIIEFLKSPNCKANLQLFESILSLILAVEENIPKLNENTKNLLPVIIDNMAHSDWNVRKIAIEVIYTLSVLIPDILALYKHALLDVLNHCRFDKVISLFILSPIIFFNKIKNVRDIAVSAINSIKDLKDVPQKEKRFSNSPNRENLKPNPGIYVIS